MSVHSCNTWPRQKTFFKKKNGPDITGRKSFCGISGSAKVLNNLSSLSWNSHRVSVGRHFVTWEQSERSSDCRSDTKHVLCHLFRSPFTIDWPNGGKKTKLNNPFGSVCKGSRCFSRPSSTASRWHAKHLWRLTRRPLCQRRGSKGEKDVSVTVRVTGARNLSPSKLLTKGKVKGIIQSMNAGKKLRPACEMWEFKSVYCKSTVAPLDVSHLLCRPSSFPRVWKRLYMQFAQGLYGRLLVCTVCSVCELRDGSRQPMVMWSLHTQVGGSLGLRQQSVL